MPHGEHVILCVKCREEVSTSQLNDLRGISNNERVDEALYQDTETTAQRKARPLWKVCTLNMAFATAQCGSEYASSGVRLHSRANKIS